MYHQRAKWLWCGQVERSFSIRSSYWFITYATHASLNLLSSGLLTVRSFGNRVQGNIILFGVGNFKDEIITLPNDCNMGKFVCLSKHHVNMFNCSGC